MVNIALLILLEWLRRGRGNPGLWKISSFHIFRTIYRLKNPVNKKHQRMLFKNITFHSSCPTHSRFRPDEGLLNISVNRNRRCFKSQRSGAEVCARTKLRDVQGSVLLHTQKRAVNCETCCSHAAVYLWNGFSPSRGTRGAARRHRNSVQPLHRLRADVTSNLRSSPYS